MLGMAAPLVNAAAARAGVDMSAALPAPLRAAGSELGQLGRAAAAITATRLVYAALRAHRRRRRQRQRQLDAAASVPVPSAVAVGQPVPTPTGRLLRHKSSVNCESTAAAVESPRWPPPSNRAHRVSCSPRCPHPASHRRPRLLPLAHTMQWRRWWTGRTWTQPSGCSTRRRRRSGRLCMRQRCARCGACCRCGAEVGVAGRRAGGGAGAGRCARGAGAAAWPPALTHTVPTRFCRLPTGEWGGAAG